MTLKAAGCLAGYCTCVHESFVFLQLLDRNALAVVRFLVDTLSSRPAAGGSAVTAAAAFAPLLDAGTLHGTALLSSVARWLFTAVQSNGIRRAARHGQDGRQDVYAHHSWKHEAVAISPLFLKAQRKYICHHFMRNEPQVMRDKSEASVNRRAFVFRGRSWCRGVEE